MFLEAVARRLPERIACRMARSGEELTYSELDYRTRQGVDLLHSLGVR